MPGGHAARPAALPLVHGAKMSVACRQRQDRPPAPPPVGIKDHRAGAWRLDRHGRSRAARQAGRQRGDPRARPHDGRVARLPPEPGRPLPEIAQAAAHLGPAAAERSRSSGTRFARGFARPRRRSRRRCTSTSAATPASATATSRCSRRACTTAPTASSSRPEIPPRWRRTCARRPVARSRSSASSPTRPRVCD